MTALAVALLGATPLGHATLSAVPAFAKKAGYANNAGAVNGIKASKTPRAGQLVPLGADGKFAASVGQAGPQGPNGDAGAQGPKGDTGAKGDTGPKGDKGATGATGQAGAAGLAAVEIVTADSVNDNLSGLKEATATCPSGKKVIGGGTQSISSPVINSYGWPVGTNAWHGQGYSSGGAFFSVRAYAICATVAS